MSESSQRKEPQQLAEAIAASRFRGHEQELMPLAGSKQ